MKKFILTISLFIMTVLVIHIALDYIVTQELRTTKMFQYELWNDIADNKIDAEVLFLGTSRAADHYDVQAFDSALGCTSHNFGRPSHRVKYNVMPYIFYREVHRPLPKIIIYDIYHENLQIFQEDELQQYAQLIYNNNFRKFALEHRCDNWFPNTYASLYIPYYRYFGYIEHIKYAFEKQKKNEAQYTIKGFIPLYTVREEQWQAIAADNNVGKISETAKGIIEDQVIKWSIDNKVKVVLVHSPYYNYEEKRKKFREYESFDSLITYYKTAYNIPFLDYSRGEIARCSLNFVDPAHLNAAAARLFTLKLAHDLDSLGIIKKADRP